VAVLRSETFVRALRDGKVLGKAPLGREEPSPARVDESGRWAVAPGADGGLRVWDLERMTQAITLVDFRDDEWIALSPKGAYTGTSEVADRVGWVYDRPLEHFSFEQFSSTFRDPALIAARLRGDPRDEDASIERPPRVELLGPPELAADAQSARVRARVRAEGRVDVLRAFVEGRPVAERAVCQPSGEMSISAFPSCPATTAFTSSPSTAEGSRPTQRCPPRAPLRMRRAAPRCGWWPWA
jgi:hypothetical protein